MRKILMWFGVFLVGVFLLWWLLPKVFPVKVPDHPHLKGITLKLQEPKVSPAWKAFLLEKGLFTQAWSRMKYPLDVSKVSGLRAKLQKHKRAIELFEKAIKSDGCLPLSVLPKYDAYKKKWHFINWIRAESTLRRQLHVWLAEGKSSKAAMKLASWIQGLVRVEQQCPKHLTPELVLLSALERMVTQSASVFGAPGLSKEAETALHKALHRAASMKFESMVEAFRVDFSSSHRQIYIDLNKSNKKMHFLGRWYQALFWDQKLSKEIQRKNYRGLLSSLQHMFKTPPKDKREPEDKTSPSFRTFVERFVAKNFHWGSRFRDTSIDSILLGVPVGVYFRFAHRWRLVRCKARAHLARAMKRLSIPGKTPNNILAKKPFTGGDIVNCGDMSGKAKKVTLAPWAPYQEKK